MTLSDALTYWTAPHPAWTPNPEWPEDVGFVTWASPDAYVFVDPLISGEWDDFDRAVSASGCAVAVLLTAPWHERSVRAVVDRYDAAVWIHPRGRARIADLPALTKLPAGIETFVPDGSDEGQVAFYIVPERALVVAEFFLGTDGGLRVLPSPATTDLDAFKRSLDRLRDLPVDYVLVAHGPPMLADAKTAIAVALDEFSS